MSASETAIANRALQKLGVARIMSMNDDSKAARACKAAFAAVRDAELRQGAWRFALTRTTLEALTGAPDFGYAYWYALPSDCLRLIQVGEYAGAMQTTTYRDSGEAAYVIEDNKILTDMAAPLSIRYVKRVTDTSKFDALFDEALACKLAAELSEELTGSDGKGARAERDYMALMAEARRINAVERAPEGIADDSWVLARL